MKLNKIILSVLLFSLPTTIIAQKQLIVNKLAEAIKSEKSDIRKAELYIELGDQYKSSAPDSALIFYKMGLKYSQNINSQENEAKCLRSIGFVYLNQGDYDNAIDYSQKSLRICEKQNDKGGIAASYNIIGNYHLYVGNTNKAINLFQKALKLYEEIDDKKGITGSYCNISIVLCGQGEYDKAREYFFKSIKICEDIGDKEGMSRGYNNIGIIYLNQGNYDKALEYYFKSLKIDDELGNDMSVGYSNIGSVYYYQGNYSKALEYYHKSLKLKEKRRDKKGISTCYKNIGLVHADQGNNAKALDYYEKSLKIKKELGDKRGMSGDYNNIGIILFEKKNYNKALSYFTYSLKICEELGDKSGMSEGYQNISSVLSTQGKNKKALIYLLKTLKIKEELGDKNGIAIVHDNIASLEIDTKRYPEAIASAQKGLTIAKEIGSLMLQKSSYEFLSMAHDSLHNYKRAYEFFKLFKSINDSIFNETSSKQIKEMEAQYQNEEKQQKIELQRAEMKRLTLQKQALSGGLILMLILAVVSYYSFKQKKKANLMLSEQKVEIEDKNEELSQQNEEIEAQRDEIEAQRDFLMLQKNKIEEIHQELADSINYAKLIQQAILPNHSAAKTILGDHFILLKPRNVVSGDFYWFAEHKDCTLIAVADCTGHGVPGAFMSMLGISFLNEFVAKSNGFKASQVLDEMRKHIIITLQQQGIPGEQKEGMDISFAIINKKTMTMQYAGANNSIYIYRKETNILEKVKPDRMPVGIHVHMEPFTNHDIQISKNDTIYMFSDGFPDQFGGPHGRKFMYSRFEQLLVENSSKPLKVQGEIIDLAINTWKNGSEVKYEQTDDITIMGVRIN